MHESGCRKALVQRVCINSVVHQNISRFVTEADALNVESGKRDVALPPDTKVDTAKEHARAQREDDMEDISEEMEVDDGDCLLDSDTSTPFILAEDAFGRQRRIRTGSVSARRLQEKRESASRDLVHDRKLASYEDI